MDPSVKSLRRLSFPLAVGFLLWGISGVITVSLFLDLAGQNLGSILFAVLWAGSLEASKIITWRRGGWYRCLSVCLMVLTLFSALGIAFQTVEVTQDQSTRRAESESREYQDQVRLVDSLQQQIFVLVQRLAALPPGYVTAAANLSKDLAGVRSQLTKARDDMKNLEGATLQGLAGQGPFNLLARTFGWDRKILEIIVILVVSALTEASAMVLASHRISPRSGAERVTRPEDSMDQTKGTEDRAGSGVSPEPTPDHYLNAALNHPNAPRLLGREKVARLLGISEPQARKLLEQLVRSGRVRRGTKSFQVDPVPGQPDPRASRSRLTNP